MIEFKNPIGFKNYSSEDTVLDACFCANHFAVERGSSDNCSHCDCGCNASSANANANFSVALCTSRTN